MVSKVKSEKIKKKIADLLSKYLRDKTCLVLERGSTSRVTAKKIMCDMGMLNTKIVLTDSFNQAMANVQNEKPNIIIAAYEMDEKNVFELLSEHLKVCPNRMDSFFFVLGDSTCEELESEIEEYDADAHIIRPFTYDKMSTVLFKLVRERAEKTTYRQAIELGRSTLFSGNMEKAKELFMRAIEENPETADPYYFLGRIFMTQEKYELARTQFEDGLKKDNRHYKCLLGMFDSNAKLRDFKKASEAAQTMMFYKPINPYRLPDFIKVAIACNNIEQIGQFMAVLKDQNFDSEDLKNQICAGLVVSAKQFKLMGHPDKAKEMLSYVGRFNINNENIAAKLAEQYIEMNDFKAAEKVLFQFVTQENCSPKFKELEFIIFDRTGGTHHKVLEKGIQLVNDNVKSFEIYEAILRSAKQVGKSAQFIDEYLSDAMRLFPEKKTIFSKYAG